MRTTPTPNRWLWAILTLALVLRVIVALGMDHAAPYADTGGDSWYYLGNAYALITGQDPPGMVTYLSHLTPPPLYFIILGVPQALVGYGAEAVLIVRLFQALLSAATCYFAYALARRLTGRETAGLLAALALALSPALIVESTQILTETVYIFLVAGGVWLYVESMPRRSGFQTRPSPETAGDAVSIRRNVMSNPSPPLHEMERGSGGEVKVLRLVGAAVLLGLAALTRAVVLAFPFGLALHALIVYGWRGGFKRAALLLVVYALVVSTWTVYSLARWDRFVIAGDGFFSFIYLGVAGWDDPEVVDEQLFEISPEGNYAEAAASTIARDPLGWARRRVSELAGAYLQPHGTTFYGGESLRDLALAALRGERSVMDVLRGDNFLPKLALYLLHYAALIGGLAGMWLYRHRWRVALPMIGFIAYVTLVHLLLYALPRYLLPAEIFWWVFAAAALDWLINRRGRALAQAAA